MRTLSALALAFSIASCGNPAFAQDRPELGPKCIPSEAFNAHNAQNVQGPIVKLEPAEAKRVLEWLKAINQLDEAEATEVTLAALKGKPGYLGITTGHDGLVCSAGVVPPGLLQALVDAIGGTGSF